MKLIISLIFLTFGTFLINKVNCEEVCEDDLIPLFSGLDWNKVDDKELLRYYIKKIYSKNVENTEKIIKFINRLKFLEQKTLSYRFLYNEMVENDHVRTFYIFYLLFNIKKIQYSMESDNIKFIINDLPEFIRKLSFNQSDLRIINKNENLIYYSMKHIDLEIDHHRYGTFVKEIIETQNENGDLWQLQPEDDGKTFKIYNKNLKRYLQADTTKQKENRRFAFLWKSLSDTDLGWAGSDEWWIIPHKKYDYFILRNVYWEEDLYVFDDKFTFGKPVFVSPPQPESHEEYTSNYLWKFSEL